MNSESIKRNIHQLIDGIEDEELLTNYLKLLKKDASRTQSNFFWHDEDEMITRAKTSLQSVKAGRTRYIKDFKADFEKWRLERTL
ncbi:MAG: hypothetical protein J0L66_16635 [Cytophagales bacterium]|nr:hypothetical protein [Cytophagales bacterium]